MTRVPHLRPKLVTNSELCHNNTASVVTVHVFRQQVRPDTSKTGQLQLSVTAVTHIQRSPADL
jgi:hypothetical protein